MHALKTDKFPYKHVRTFIVGNRRQGRPEGSLFNSFYTEV